MESSRQSEATWGDRLAPQSDTSTSPDFPILSESQLEQVSDDPKNELSLRQKLGNVMLGVKSDWAENSASGKTVQVAALAGQAAERLRISELVLAPTVVDVFRDTQSPLKTSLAAFAIVFGAQGFISTTWAEAMDKSPETVDAINTNFPKLTEYAEDIGMSKKRRWYSHIREGWSTFWSLGVTPFVVAEKIQTPDIDRKDLHVRAAALTGKCALTGAGIAYGFSEFVMHQDPEVATKMLDIVGNPLLWIGMAYGVELPRFVGKRLERRRARKAAL
jgi:hypothetical protein